MKLMVHVAIAASTVLPWPATAWAADELGLSNDGVTFHSNLAEPLFDSTVRWVPGDRREDSFWVRNQSNDGALLNIAVAAASVDSLMQTGDLRVQVRAGDGPWRSTNRVGRQELVSSMPVAPGQLEKVTVAIDFDRAAINQSQTEQFALDFDVRLTQDTAVNNGSKNRSRTDSDSDASDSDGDGRGLPGTGGPSWWLLPLGVAMAAFGGAVRSGTRGKPGHG